MGFSIKFVNTISGLLVLGYISGLFSRAITISWIIITHFMGFYSEQRRFDQSEAAMGGLIYFIWYINKHNNEAVVSFAPFLKIGMNRS